LEENPDQADSDNDGIGDVCEVGPAVTDHCSSVVHGTGQSTLAIYFQFSGIEQGSNVTIEITGPNNFSATQTSTVDANGIAGVSVTINWYGSYTGTVTNITDPSDGNVTVPEGASENIEVTAEEPTCHLQ
jgi:hypothetical protein